MSQSDTIRILLADDHAMFREGLKQVLSRTTDLVVADEAENAQQVLDNVEKKEFDVIVLDISMPGRDGIDVLKQLKHTRPNLHILVLSMYPEDQYAVRAIKAGASGYLTKNKASQELIDAIRRIASGRRYISPDVAEQLAIDIEGGSERPLHKKLSDREYQVMCLIASGKTVKEIAGELSLSVSSISTMRTRILKKFNMKTNAEITHYAIKHNLVN